MIRFDPDAPEIVALFIDGLPNPLPRHPPTVQDYEQASEIGKVIHIDDFKLLAARLAADRIHKAFKDSNSIDTKRIDLKDAVLYLAAKAQTRGIAKSQVRKLLNVKDSRWAMAVRHLIEEGKLEMRGAKRGARYYLPEYIIARRPRREAVSSAG